MKKFVVSAMVLVTSVVAMAQLTSSVIPKVNKEDFEKGLKKRMGVHRVQINTLKENKIKNGVGDIVGIIDEASQDQRFYNLQMVVDESLFNDRLHVVSCEVVLFKKDQELLVHECKSNSSTVESMVIKISEISS